VNAQAGQGRGQEGRRWQNRKGREGDSTKNRGTKSTGNLFLKVRMRTPTRLEQPSSVRLLGSDSQLR